MADIKTLASQANVDITHAGDVIQQIYRQVFGNKHLMELDINPSLEALFMNGDMNVQEFVFALAQSETYKRMFLEPNSQYRFVELNFKHLLGRPPRDQSELMEHVRLFADEGYESEIASYIYNEEYLSVFGLDKVPYNRASESIKGGTTIGYTRAAILDPGYAGFDGSTQKGKLTNSLGTATSPFIVERKAIGTANSFTIVWTSRIQVGPNRRAVQKSVVTQSSMSSTIRGIQSQGGSIQSIRANA
jgi:phycoerythrin-associated linker protein